MDSAKKQLADRLKTANNILVTVSRDPSVDQLAACIGLTLLLNKLNKHTVAVFGGTVPSTIEFLKPEETIQKNTDSLRDFIIALDKDKADKLRYKVENNVVRIFITPYRTSISEDDLEFSQGDFNVDAVVALGVKRQEDLDESITAHGRILHDATLTSINLSEDGGLGTINWHDAGASSLSELVTELAQVLGDNLLDTQVATALLTGIVAATDRFSNDKTSPKTMSASSALMAAGANQQLVATKLEEAAASTTVSAADGETAAGEDGTLNIKHEEKEEDEAEKTEEPAGPGVPTELPAPQVTETPAPETPPVPPTSPDSSLSNGSKLITEPPTLGGTLSANTKPEGLDPVTDPMSMPSAEPNQLLDRAAEPSPGQPPAPAPDMTPPPANWNPPAVSQPPEPMPASPEGSQTLTEIEKSVNSPHVNSADQLDTARDEVTKALRDSVDPTPAPIQALNAQPLSGRLHQAEPELKDQPTLPGSVPPESSITDPNPTPSPDTLSPTPQVNDPNAPPPYPPPLQFGADPANNAPNQNQQNPPL